MKKIMLGAVAVVSLALVFACSTQPAAPTQPAEKPVASTAKKVEPQKGNTQKVAPQPAGELILEGAQKYTVVSGDVLVKIARSYYQNGFYYPIIIVASNGVVLDQDQIEPGMELTIPDLQKNLANPNARATIKNLLKEAAQIEDRRNRHATAEGLRQNSDRL